MLSQFKFNWVDSIKLELTKKKKGKGKEKNFPKFFSGFQKLVVQIIKIKKRRDFWFCKNKERERDKKKGRENYFENVSNKEKKLFFSKFVALNFTTKEKSD